MENRLLALEKKVDVLENEWQCTVVTTAEFNLKFNQISKDIDQMKTDVTKAINDQFTFSKDQMNKQWKLIIGLIGTIIMLLGGAKFAPEIFKAII